MRVISMYAFVLCSVCACVRVCACLCVIVLGRGANNNNNTVFGGKRPSGGGGPNKRNSQTRRDTEKETQTNMLWEKRGRSIQIQFLTALEPEAV